MQGNTSGAFRNLAAGFGIAVWVGLLALPLTGPLPAVRIAAGIFTGGLIWAAASRAGRSRWFSGEAAARLRSRYHRFAQSPSRLQPLITGRKHVFLGLLVLILAVLPAAINNYYIDVLTLAGIYVVLALGLNIVVGMAGLLDLGYVSFYAIGAYTYALLSTRLDVSFWVALPLGGLSAALFGVALGFITLRLRGDYLAIVTLGFIQIVNLILKNWDSVTNGPNGILGIGRPAIGGFVFSRPVHFYYLILAIAMLAVFSVDRLNRSRIGRAWIAIREDEIAAGAMGVDTTRMKVLAFALGAAWAGVAGVFFAGKFAFVSPESFTFLESVIVLSMVVLGGMGSIPGVIIGALIIIILPELLREFSNYRMLIFGLALTGMMIFRPQGLIGNPRRLLESHSEGKG